jgi:hypothetical protein
MATDTSTALEKPATKTPEVITRPDEFRGALLRWQEQRFNVLTPFTNISGLAPAHAIYSSALVISVEENAQEVYKGLPFLKPGQVAIAKRGLRKIAEGLGISTRLEYISVAAIPNYWHVKAIASYTGIDGMPVVREGGQEWDLRDGSARMKGWQPAQIQEARKHGLRQCETRAINAAIRECGCGIKQAYTIEELSRPFVAVRVAVQPNMDDPEQARMVLAAKLGAVNTMYPQRALPASADAFAEDDHHPPQQHVGRGSTQPANEMKAEPPAEDRPPTVDAVKVVKVEAKQGETNGRKWTRYVVIDSTGTEASTFDKKLADAAQSFLDRKSWVEITTQTENGHTNLIEIVGAGESPKLPGMDSL